MILRKKRNDEYILHYTYIYVLGMSFNMSTLYKILFLRYINTLLYIARHITYIYMA